MGIFDFFDYTPKSFLKDDLSPKEPIEILNMKENKVKNNFDEKYKDDETYQTLDKKTKDSIFLLRVLKKGLKQEDKQHVLSICFDNKDTESNNAIMKQPDDPYSKYNKTTERKSPSMKPSQQPNPSIEAPTTTMQEAPPTNYNNNEDEQEGGNSKRVCRNSKKKKPTKTKSKKKKGCKKTKRRHY